jgi:hypothetical protein
MIDDDENIARDDYLDYLIEQALLEELADLKRKGELNSTPLYTPHNDTGTTAYCGPTAMAAVTGEPISVIENTIHRVAVTGMYDVELLAAMELLGFYVVEQWNSNGVRYTLDRFAKEHGRDGPFIVAVTGHLVAISQGEFCDTSTMLPCDLFGGVLDQQCWCKRIGSTWVRNWWRFHQLPGFEKAAVARMRISARE